MNIKISTGSWCTLFHYSAQLYECNIILLPFLPFVSSFLSSLLETPLTTDALSSATVAAVAVDDGGLLLLAAEPLFPDPPIIVCRRRSLSLEVYIANKTVNLTCGPGMYERIARVQHDGKSTRNFFTNTRVPTGRKIVVKNMISLTLDADTLYYNNIIVG